MDPKIIAAIVTAVASLLVAIATAILARRAQRQLHKHAVELEQLKAQFVRRASQDQARQDYEYEARKRLYQSCAPLQFQLASRCEDLLHRIYSLARAARRGELEPGTGWLSEAYVSRNPYYFRSTL